MVLSILYALLAILGLGFLVFIHELGHYFAARREGMRVEAFSIGFGKALYAWNRSGVRWQIGWLPFGGYVKIAGMQKEGQLEPYEIPDGFYGKSPLARIKVAFAGPLVNIVFAFVAFSAVWALGGRVKQFGEFTQRIGWVDPGSELYREGVRPGDVIERYDGRPFHSFRDLLVASVIDGKETSIEGFKVDYLTGERKRFQYTLPTYDDIRMREKLHTIGVFSPASYLIYQGEAVPGSPMVGSGVEKGDRILWADGELLFSPQQLSSELNQSTVFLTILRDGEIFQTKAPRVHIDELKLTAGEKGEIDDWRREAGVKGKLPDLFFIPYTLTNSAEVEERIDFIDEQDQQRAFETCARCAYFNPLKPNDKILAVDGTPIATSYDLMRRLQTRNVLLIVQRDPVLAKKELWTEAERRFENMDPADLQKIASSIGTDHPIYQSGSLLLLKPVAPKLYLDFDFTPEQREAISEQLVKAKEEIQKNKDSAKRDAALRMLNENQNRAMLGFIMEDREVIYNPGPFATLWTAVKDTWRTLSALFSGSLSPKFVSGPVGIVHVVQQSWTQGAKDALFWMGVISLNLGLANLLPLPVLDGGHICLSFLEIFTKRPLRAKTMERLIIPFIGLLIIFFLFVTYQDVQRLFSSFF